MAGVLGQIPNISDKEAFQCFCCFAIDSLYLSASSILISIKNLLNILQYYVNIITIIN